MCNIAIIILNWNGIGFLKKFLPDIIKYSVDENCKVFVADNGSDDNSLEYLTTVLEEPYIIRFNKNYGYALGYEKALEQIDASYFVLLNSDVEVTENWIDPVIKYMEDHPDIAACMPKIKSYHNREFFEYAGASGGYIDKYGYPYCRGRIMNITEKDNGQYDDIKQIFWATGACLFIKSKPYFAAGGLDGNFFAHMEEIDLCWRINNLGYKIMVYPKVKVFHVGGGSLAMNSPRKVYYNFRNSLYLLYKNLPENKFRRILLTRLILDGVAAIKFLISFKFSFFISLFKAHIDFWKNLKNLKDMRRVTLKNQAEKPSILPENLSIISAFFIKRKKYYSQL